MNMTERDKLELANLAQIIKGIRANNEKIDSMLKTQIRLLEGIENDVYRLTHQEELQNKLEGD